MDRPPNFSGNMLPCIGGGDENDHQIEADCPQSCKQRFITRMERNENVRETEWNYFVVQQKYPMDQGKDKCLQRNPTVEIQAAQTQKIFSDSRQA